MLSESYVLSLAYDLGCMPEQCTDESLTQFANTVRDMTLEEAAKIVEEALWPRNTLNMYKIQYNDGILRKAKQIRDLKCSK